MYCKWRLKRYPFYTQPIDQLSLYDFVAREKELRMINDFVKHNHGVYALVSDYGTGTSSIANNYRFSQEYIYTIPLEIKLKHFSTRNEFIISLIYSIAKDLADLRLSTEFDSFIRILSLKSNNYNFHSDSLKDCIAIVKDGIKEFYADKNVDYSELLTNLINEVLRITGKQKAVIQLCGMNLRSEVLKQKIIDIIFSLVDFNNIQSLVFMLLIEAGLMEELIKDSAHSKKNVIKNWMHIDPLSYDEFEKVFAKRIENSGYSAKNPFTESGIRQLYKISRSRLLFAMDIAGSILKCFSEKIYPDTFDAEIVNKHAWSRIDHVVGKDKFSAKTNEVLKAIVLNPGISSTDLSKQVDIQSGNLTKSVNVLIENQVVEKITHGRIAKHFVVGMAELLTVNE